jgi:hypothetical protein
MDPSQLARLLYRDTIQQKHAPKDRLKQQMKQQREEETTVLAILYEPAHQTREVSLDPMGRMILEHMLEAGLANLLQCLLRLNL